MFTTVTDKLSPLLSYLDTLSGERADVQKLAEALDGLKGLTVEDLADYAVFSNHGYQRNLVVDGTMYEVLVLCWKSGQRSPIHDHAHSVCGIKILKGKLTEVRYRESPCGQVVAKDSRQLGQGDICASSDHDIHEVSNLEEPGQDLVTMHIYSPPLREMAMYDPAKPGMMTYRPENLEFHGGSGI